MAVLLLDRKKTVQAKAEPHCSCHSNYKKLKPILSLMINRGLWAYFVTDWMLLFALLNKLPVNEAVLDYVHNAYRLLFIKRDVKPSLFSNNRMHSGYPLSASFSPWCQKGQRCQIGEGSRQHCHNLPPLSGSQSQLHPSSLLLQSLQ